MRGENLCAAAPAKGCAGTDSVMQYLPFYMQNLPEDIGKVKSRGDIMDVARLGYGNKTMK